MSTSCLETIWATSRASGSTGAPASSEGGVEEDNAPVIGKRRKPECGPMGETNKRARHHPPGENAFSKLVDAAGANTPAHQSVAGGAAADQNKFKIMSKVLISQADQLERLRRETGTQSEEIDRLRSLTGKYIETIRVLYLENERLRERLRREKSAVTTVDDEEADDDHDDPDRGGGRDHEAPPRWGEVW